LRRHGGAGLRRRLRLRKIARASGTALPEYARPLFLRIRDHIQATATFKQKKLELARQGFDPDKIADPLYFNDAQARAFVRLDRALYQRIQAGQVRL
jgi:fatty-acyl-CoA synthase